MFLLTINNRNRDKLPIVAKLSHQPLRLEREYHIVQRLYRQVSVRDLLLKPLERITIPNSGLIAFIYEDLCDNRLENFQPYNAPELLHNHRSSIIWNHDEHEKISFKSFLHFAIQCCNCLEMIHKNQSKNFILFNLHWLTFYFSRSWRNQIECFVMAKR